MFLHSIAFSITPCKSERDATDEVAAVEFFFSFFVSSIYRLSSFFVLFLTGVFEGGTKLAVVAPFPYFFVGQHEPSSVFIR